MDELKGIGHFTVGFIAGFGFFLILRRRLDESRGLTFLKLYLPFLPLAAGFFALIPYLLFKLGLATHEDIMGPAYNFFILYGVLGNIQIFNSMFAKFEIDALLLACGYTYLVRYYIKLIRGILRNAQ